MKIMALKLNQDHEYARIDGYKFPFYKEFYGRNVDQMPSLLDFDCNRSPMSIAQLIKRKLDVRDINPDVKDAWMNNFFDTSDLKAQRGNEIKLVLTTYANGSITPLGREYLELFNPQEQLINMAINLGINNRYENLSGEGVLTTTREKLAEIIDSPLTIPQAKDSLFWRFVLRHPDIVSKEFAIPGLHEEAIPYIFAEFQARHAKNTPMDNLRLMGVFPGSCQKNVSEMRAWFIGWLEIMSNADGSYSLNHNGRLVGIAPEALSAQGMNTLNIKGYIPTDVRESRKELDALTQVRPELLERTKSLLEKL
jgi:hypothetical protein